MFVIELIEIKQTRLKKGTPINEARHYNIHIFDKTIFFKYRTR